MTVHSAAKQGTPVEIEIMSSSGRVLSSKRSRADYEFSLVVESPVLWSPSTPALYPVKVRMGSDEIFTYTGFRTIETATIDGVRRPVLNGQFVFLMGTLDQGYWPDGLYVPPSREAMVYDLVMLRELGFNMLRKHVSRIPASRAPQVTGRVLMAPTDQS